MIGKLFQRVSQAPTNPHAKPAPQEFDVANLYRGPVTVAQEGGTALGSSRGPQPTGVIVDFLTRRNIQILFCVGGDGTLRGARDIAVEAARRGLNLAVVGIPKTVDNDIHFVGPTFGFETAVYHSTPVITSAHVEAKNAYRGIGLVRLMGRDSGFIAAYSALANPVVNICLIPEQELVLEGESGLLRGLALREQVADVAQVDRILGRDHRRIRVRERSRLAVNAVEAAVHAVIVIRAAGQAEDARIVLQSGPDEVVEQALDEAAALVLRQQRKEFLGTHQRIDRLVDRALDVVGKRERPLAPTLHPYAHDTSTLRPRDRREAQRAGFGRAM